MLTRRIFLRGSAMVMAGAGSAPFWLGRAAAASGGKRKVLVAIFQRGACDGLNVVVPFADKRYYELRPSIGIPAPAGGSPAASGRGVVEVRSTAGVAAPNIILGPNGQSAIDLDGRFGL